MPMTPEEQTAFDAMKADAEKAKKDLEDFKKATPPKPEPKPEPKPDPEDDLSDKASKKKKEDDETKEANAKLESALTFNLNLKTFLTDNKDFLPEEITGIVEAAEKETYDSKMDKANDIKASIVKSFFGVQTNLDLLSEAQKKNLDVFLKMSKAMRQEKAENVWENIFEPAFITLQKVYKAQQLNRTPGGYNSNNPIDQSYKEKLMKGSKSAYLSEKGATK